MTEENNIEKTIRDKFNYLAEAETTSRCSRYQDWEFFINQQKNLPCSLKINIDYTLNLENWHFNDLNLEFIITENASIYFRNCNFKALKIISNPDVILNEFCLNGCSFQGDAEINVKLSSKFDNQAIFDNKFYGNKCLIKSNLDISLANVEFGNPQKKDNDFELNILSDSKFYGYAQFYAKKLLIETNSVDLNCINFTFNVNELVIDGKKDSAIRGNIKSGIQNEILLKNLINVKNFSWMNADTNPKKLSFENAGTAIFDSLKNIELSGSAEFIAGKFENCNFKNISGEISAEIYGQSKFINCNNITTEKEIFIKLDGNKGSSNNPHNITIENSTITKLHFSQNHKLCVKDSSLIDIILNKCDLLKIEDSKITNITLENCQFNDAIILNNVTFSQSPHISNIKFSSHNVEMRNLKFTDNLSSQASGSYRAWMKACQDAGYENGVIFFHAKELQTRHNYLKNNIIKSIKKFKIFSIFDDFIEIFLLFFHKCFSKYGASLFRPLLWIFGIFIFLIPCYLASDKGAFYLAFTLIEARDFSLKNSLGPLIFALPKEFIEEKFLKNLPSSIKILCFLQTVICSSIWFVWFFMVRRRFKI
jgi:hypothetical protein